MSDGVLLLALGIIALVAVTGGIVLGELTIRLLDNAAVNRRRRKQRRDYRRLVLRNKERWSRP